MKYFISLLFIILVLKGNAQNGPSIDVNDDIRVSFIGSGLLIHTSWLDREPYGSVAANGLIILDGDEAFIIDSPWNNEQTATLCKWIEDSLHVTIKGFIPSHWHEDCMGGMDYINKAGIPSFALQTTIDSARNKNLPIPKTGFTDSLRLKCGTIEFLCFFPGEGHTTDNIVVWIPKERVLFGGCLVKSMNSTNLGNTRDGNLNAYPETIKTLLDLFGNAEIIIPGHGESGNKTLLEHTLEMANKH